MPNRGEVVISIAGDEVLVTQPDLRTDRSARLMFGSILGALPTQDGWRCPRRSNSINTLVVRINTFLETKGWSVRREGIADEAVQREIERKRSFERTRESASALRNGDIRIDLTEVKTTLRSYGWNETGRALLEHQERGLVHGLTALNAANFSVPGSGKTATTLAVATAHLASGTVDVIVVVGPLSCFGPWEKEVRLAVQRSVKTKRIRGSAGQRRTIYASVRKGHLLLVSYAAAAADRLALIELCRSYRVMLVVDESHRVKRFRGGIWAPALMEIAKHARVKMILSGTPMPQSGKDLFSQLNILWPFGELTGPRDSFATRVDREFASVLRDIRPFVSRTPKDALGLPPYEVVRHEVPLSSTQAEIYDLIESNFRRRVEGAASWQEKLDALRRGRPIRLLQAATNPDLLNRADTYYRLPQVDIPNPTLMERLAAYRITDVPAKSKAALELVREMVGNGEKVVCWSNFVPNLDYFSELINDTFDCPCFQIDGRVPTGDDALDDDPKALQQNPDDVDTRERIIEQFLNVQGAAVMVTNPASCSESISLHRSCHNAIYLDRTYDCALFLQSIDRIHRLGLPEGTRVRVHILLATLEGRRTVDHLADSALQKKEVTMKQLLEGAELRPFELSTDPLDTAEGNDEDLAELLRFLLGEGS